MGNAFVLTAVILLLALSAAGMFIQAIWRHGKAQAVFFAGVASLVAYLIIQVLAWKDLSEVQSVDSVRPIWGMAGFNSGAYDATAWIGFVLVAVGGILCIQKSRKAKNAIGASA